MYIRGSAVGSRRPGDAVFSVRSYAGDGVARSLGSVGIAYPRAVPEIFPGLDLRDIDGDEGERGRLGRYRRLGVARLRVDDRYAVPFGTRISFIAFLSLRSLRTFGARRPDARDGVADRLLPVRVGDRGA